MKAPLTNLVATSCLLIAASIASGQVIIVDNTDAGFSTSGAGWTSSANPGFVGTTGAGSLINAVAAAGTAQAVWRPTLPEAGTYDVFTWWVSSFNRAGDAPYRVHHADGVSEIFANQKTNGGRWNLLGRYRFEAGEAGFVDLTDRSPESSLTYVSADAVRFAKVDDPTNSFPTVPDIPFRVGGCVGGCAGQTLFGNLEPGPVKYYLISDLPESFGSAGLLYTTRPVIPEQPAGLLSLEARTQVNRGFTAIDDDFDIFVFHINPGGGTTPKRMMILAENIGTESVTVTPQQVIVTDGVIGNVHEMESNLGRRFVDGQFDATADLGETVTIAPGAIEVVGYSKRFPTAGNDADRSQNTNCFGLIRGLVEGNDPRLHLHVVAIDANNSATPANPPFVNVAAARTAAVNLLNVAASSNENMDLSRPPFSCELRRSNGVFPRHTWRSELYTYDVGMVGGGASFAMGLDNIRTGSCPEQSQTSLAYLHPTWVHPEDIGNYHKDYRLQFRVVNSSSEPRPFDLQFGSASADIGFVYQLVASEDLAPDAIVDQQPAQTLWAGPNQTSTFKSFLPAPIMMEPGELLHVALRFQLLGNSSTPFIVQIPDLTGPQFDVRSISVDTAAAGESVTLELIASESIPQAATATLTVNGAAATQTLNQTPNHRFQFTIPQGAPGGFARMDATGRDAAGNQATTELHDVLRILGVDPLVLEGLWVK